MGVFEKALISGEGILKYIPQRPPMVMVDSYYGRVEGASYTGYTPAEGSLLCEGGFFQETGIIEHIAQSAAVCAGVEFIGKGEVVPVGFIGAVSKFNVVRLPSIGTTLHTTTREIQKFMDVSLVCSEVEVDGEIIATGELKIFLQKRTDNNQ
ncbi:MAG: hypothetical protein A2X18_11865 [Bacteroidetes bacterium GWF2_40_14]|nr:MAG: hypothetical protein A2X18_11865 [Bacteroidetes bacterium GWF2_40_14]